eukprot:PhM_4_TR18019/c0_g1_i1/m.2958
MMTQSSYFAPLLSAAIMFVCLFVSACTATTTTLTSTQGCGVIEITSYSASSSSTNVCLNFTSSAFPSATQNTMLCSPYTKERDSAERLRFASCGTVTYTSSDPSAVVSLEHTFEWRGAWDGVDGSGGLWRDNGNAGIRSQFIGTEIETFPDPFSSSNEQARVGNKITYAPSYGWVSYTLSQIVTANGANAGIVLGHDPATGDHVRMHYDDAAGTLRFYQRVGSAWHGLLSLSNLKVSGETLQFVVNTQSTKLRFSIASQSGNDHEIQLVAKLSTGAFGYLILEGEAEYAVPNFNEGVFSTQRRLTVAPSATLNKAFVYSQGGGQSRLAYASYSLNSDLSPVKSSPTLRVSVTAAAGPSTMIVGIGDGYYFSLRDPRFGRSMLNCDSTTTTTAVHCTKLVYDAWADSTADHKIDISVMDQRLVVVFVDDVVVFTVFLNGEQKLMPNLSLFTSQTGEAIFKNVIVHNEATSGVVGGDCVELSCPVDRNCGVKVTSDIVLLVNVSSSVSFPTPFLAPTTSADLTVDSPSLAFGDTHFKALVCTASWGTLMNIIGSSSTLTEIIPHVFPNLHFTEPIFTVSSITTTTSVSTYPWSVPVARVRTPTVEVLSQPKNVVQGASVEGTDIFTCAIAGVHSKGELSNFTMTLYQIIDDKDVAPESADPTGRVFVFENGTFVYGYMTAPNVTGRYVMECSVSFPSLTTPKPLTARSDSFYVTPQIIFGAGVTVSTSKVLMDSNIRLSPFELLAYISDDSRSWVIGEGSESITTSLLLQNLRAGSRRSEVEPGVTLPDSGLSGFNVLKDLMLRSVSFWSMPSTINRTTISANCASQTSTELVEVSSLSSIEMHCLRECMATSPTATKVPVIAMLSNHTKCSCEDSASNATCDDTNNTDVVVLSTSLMKHQEGSNNNNNRVNVMSISFAPHVTYRLDTVERVKIHIPPHFTTPALPSSSSYSLTFDVTPSCAYYTHDGSDYRGAESVDTAGRPCDVWPDAMKSQYPKRGLSDSRGFYCRNPTRDVRGPWCYVDGLPSQCSVGQRCPNADFIPNRRFCNTSHEVAEGSMTCDELWSNNSTGGGASIFTVNPATSNENATSSVAPYVQFDLCAIFGVTRVRVQVPSNGNKRLVVELRRNDNTTANSSTVPAISVDLSQNEYVGFDSALTAVYTATASLPINLPSYRLVRIRSYDPSKPLQLTNVEIVGSCLKVPTRYGDVPFCACDDEISTNPPTVTPTGSPTTTPTSTPDPSGPPQTVDPTTAPPTPTTTLTPSTLPPEVKFVFIVGGTPQNVDLVYVQVRVAVSLGLNSDEVQVTVVGVGSVLLRVTIKTQTLDRSIESVTALKSKLSNDQSLATDLAIIDIIDETPAPTHTQTPTSDPNQTPTPPDDTPSVTLPPIDSNATAPPTNVPTPTPSKKNDDDDDSDSNEFVGLPFWLWIVIGVGALLICVCICCVAKRQVRAVRRRRQLAKMNDQKQFYKRGGDIAAGLETSRTDVVRNPIQDIPAPGREV